MRNVISIVLAALALAGCRVDGDFDGDVDADGDQSGDADADGARVQFCPPEGGDSGAALCALDAACCEDQAGEHYCCPAPANVCVSDGTCREPCDQAVEDICDVVGAGAAIGCSPEGDGVITCSAGGYCWGRLLVPCEAGTCQAEGGEVGCR
jgi:hypothetical protein